MRLLSENEPNRTITFFSANANVEEHNWIVRVVWVFWTQHILILFLKNEYNYSRQTQNRLVCGDDKGETQTTESNNNTNKNTLHLHIYRASFS